MSLFESESVLTAPLDRGCDQFLDTLKASPESQVIIVDLDETLWLRNSTEVFLDQARPHAFVHVLLAWLDQLRPWLVLRLLGWTRQQAVFVMRDWLRIVLVCLVAPWSLLTWRRFVQSAAGDDANQPLLQALREASDNGRQIIVASHGFSPVIGPLVRALLPDAQSLGSSFWLGWLDRYRGKARAITARLGTSTLQTALFVTDHAHNDRDVLEACQDSHVVKWPAARFEPAGTQAYIPFRYTMLAKHPGRQYVLRVFLGVDAAVIALATLPASPAPLALAAAITLFMMSFFIVFEVGYHENDRIGAEREAKPVLTEARLAHLGRMNEPWAWIWAFLAAIPGFWLMHLAHPAASMVGLVASWVVLLIITRGLFAIFNRIDEKSRTLLYPFLQLCKGVGVVVALSLEVTLAGMLLLLAQPISRWIPYIVYRYGDVRWQTPDRLFRLILFVVLAITVDVIHPGPLLSDWSFWLIAAWIGWSAKGGLLKMAKDAKWLKPRES